MPETVLSLADMRGLVVIVALALLAGCGARGSTTRSPTVDERRAITRWVRHWWEVDPGFAAVRKRGLHGVVMRIRISRRDRHFASVDVAPLDGDGKQIVETAQLGLALVAGKWTIAIGPGTDLSEICTEPSPRPLVDLFCS
jgi:hypothetical protein